MAVEGAAAAAGTAVAMGAFGYNRENFMYDAELRWERFASAREYANQQAEQYREDLRTLSALTVKKNTVWTITATLCMALCVALYCAGRLGLHGPSPPAWIMGLWLTNNAAAFAYMAVCVFLSLHCAFRAQAATAHLLTRKVRVPVPTLRQLDQARLFASEFEQQGLTDIFRVPYLSHNGAPKTDEAAYDGDEQERESPTGRSRSVPARRGGGRSKCSSWVREEFETLRAGSVAGPKEPEDAAPEHFKLYAAVQKEFYQHDIYARICIFYGFVHYFQSLCFYGLGHINIELRAFWVAYGCVFVIAVLMALVLRFDIIPSNPNKKYKLPGCQFLGPLAVLPASIGMSLDFRVEFDPAVVAITWVIIFVAYLMQLVYALRMLEVMLPDNSATAAMERLGGHFLPEGWKNIPSAFQHVFYFVAPPSKLQPGQNDLVRETKQGGGGAYDEAVGNKPSKSPTAAEEKAADDDRSYHKDMPRFAFDEHVAPWKIVSSIQIVLCVSWVFLIFGTIMDVAIGEQGLVTAPHWSRPPMTRLSLKPHELGTPLGFPWPSGDKPFIPEQMAWHEEKRHADEFSFNRRLQGADAVPAASAAELSEAVAGLLDAMPAAGAVAGRVAAVAWPAFFEPRLLACGPAHDDQSSLVAALTQRGFGAAARVGAGGAQTAETFKLSGLAGLPPMVGASWAASHAEGLTLVSRAGHLVLCPGNMPAAGGVWKCGASEQLPLDEGEALIAAAAVRLPGAGGLALHVAVVHESTPDSVVIYVKEGDSWVPLGELPVPRGQSRRAAGPPSLAFVGGDLLVATAGQMLRRRLADGAVVASGPHGMGGDHWRAACGLHHGTDDVAHLRLRTETSGPELLLAAAPLLPGTKLAAAAGAPVFQ